METSPGIPSCCLKSFPWAGAPTGKITTLANLPCYVAPPLSTTSSKTTKLAILIIHDLLGYQSPNTRLLADSYASLLPGCTVFIPDFFDGEQLDADAINEGRWEELDMAGFMACNGRAEREEAVFECAKALRKSHEKVIAVGFCYGGWAALRLGSEKELVDAVIIAHPSLVTKEDIEGVVVPTQVLAAERDLVFAVEMKKFAVENLMERSVEFGFEFFPGVEHGGLLRGDEKKPGEREAMCRARDVAVSWMARHVQ